jgi:hypothetical protein
MSSSDSSVDLCVPHTSRLKKRSHPSLATCLLTPYQIQNPHLESLIIQPPLPSFFYKYSRGDAANQPLLRLREQDESPLTANRLLLRLNCQRRPCPQSFICRATLPWGHQLRLATQPSHYCIPPSPSRFPYLQIQDNHHFATSYKPFTCVLS